MKKAVFLFLTAFFVCCGKQKETPVKAIPEKITTDVATVDSVAQKTVGADEDAHGCKNSAGYTWSELRQTCLRIFESGTKLTSYESKTTTAAFVIFETNGNRAELYLPGQPTIILERKSEGEPFVNGDWQLIPWKGYVLKKAGKIMYTGQ